MAENKVKKEALLRCCMLTQALADKYWEGWTDDELKTLEQALHGDVKPMTEVIQKKLIAAGYVPDEIHGIVHDKDEQKMWDEATMKYDMVPKFIHGHWIIHFDGKTATAENIAKAVGVAPQFIEKPNRGRFAWDNMEAYLIHIKYADKHQYSPKDVVSIVSQGHSTYEQIYAERRDAWMKGRAKVAKQEAQVNIDWLISGILCGDITKEQIMLTDELFDVYSRYKRQCDDAFDTYGERRAYRTMRDMKEHNIRMAVFFIQGHSGYGKTWLANMLVENLQNESAKHGKRWTVCKTAATNPMDEYKGEEILFMDDVRGGTLTASDWLKLLDQWNTSPASARFHNKTQVACRAVIITSEKDPLEFFYYCRSMGGGDRSEAMDQFMRRIQATVQVFKADEISDPNYRISDMKKTDPYLVTMGSKTSHETMTLTYRAVNDGKDYTAEEAAQKMTDMVMENNHIDHDDHSDLGTEKIHYPNGWDSWVKDYLDESKPLNNLDWLKECAMRGNMTEDDFNRAVAKLEK